MSSYFCGLLCMHQLEVALGLARLVAQLRTAPAKVKESEGIILCKRRKFNCLQLQTSSSIRIPGGESNDVEKEVALKMPAVCRHDRRLDSRRRKDRDLLETFISTNNREQPS